MEGLDFSLPNLPVGAAQQVAYERVQTALAAAAVGDFVTADNALLSAKAQFNWTSSYGIDPDFHFGEEFASWHRQVEMAKEIWMEEAPLREAEWAEGAPVRAAQEQVAELKAEIAKIEKAEVDRLARLAREAAREVHLAMLEREATTLREKLAAMKGPEAEEETPEEAPEDALEAATPPVEEEATAHQQTEAQPETQAAKPSQSEEMLNLLIGVGVYMAFGAWLWSILSARANELF
jgi:hypothetical protein